MPFLSLLDDRAKPKGSRDPLGFELIWTHYGRQVIGNLTTITGSLTNFAVAILGFKWANDLHAHLPEADRQSRIRDSFLRYEQLAAYLRYLSGDTQIMGITRVQQRMRDKKSRVNFGIGADSQILSDQASYGLWGLYSSAMRDAGLVQGDIRLPTPIGLAIAEKIEHKLDQPYFIDMFSSVKPLAIDELEPLASTFKRAINNIEARRDLMHTLMGGTQHKQMQQKLWLLTQDMSKESSGVNGIPDFITQVKARSNGSDLAQRLTEIEWVERVLVAANNIFNYCRRKDGAMVAEIVSELEQRYSYSHLSDGLSFEGLRDVLGVQRVDILQRLLQALRNHNQYEAVMALLELNRIVMELRGGCPWVELESGSTLRVKVPNETAALLDQVELESQWDYDYFIASYINIASQGLGLSWKTQ
ncbi:MAG: hypothetical protein DHS20C01_36830 [marine bacterium B5-7]|jgi:hypothetical protein|nr:MAG: hypothetical protein DHS20C01_36830 [marine bacterium B5-7]